MKGKKVKEQKEAQKELEQSIHLVRAPVSLQQEPSLTFSKAIKVNVSQQEDHMEEWFCKPDIPCRSRTVFMEVKVIPEVLLSAIK